jgi:hypothetical protein
MHNHDRKMIRCSATIEMATTNESMNLNWDRDNSDESAVIYAVVGMEWLPMGPWGQ